MCGIMVRGFVFTCNGRGAGVRFFNCFSINMSDCIIGVEPAIPNPAIPGAFSLGTSNTGAVVDSANPTQNSFYNTFERIFVQGALLDGFQIAGGAGSFSLMANCMANNCGRYGYRIAEKCSLVACHAQSNARTDGAFGADYSVGRYDITLVGCEVYSGKPDYGNGVKISGGADAVAHFVGCTFYGAENPNQDLDDAITAVVNIQANPQNVQFTACSFLTGNSTYTSHFVYLSQYATGRVQFDNCSFIDEYGADLTVSPVAFNGTDGVMTFNNCHGINPMATKEWGNITNAHQTLIIGQTGGVPTGGTFTLTFNGQTTSAIAYNALPATIQSALEALSSIGAGNVAVSSTGGGRINGVPQHVRFQGTLANAVQPAITASDLLTPFGEVTITTILAGGPSVTFDRKDGNLHKATLSGNITPVLTDGIGKGDTITLEFIQDATGSRTVSAWSANVKTQGDFIPSPAPGSISSITHIWDGTYWVEVSRSLGTAAAALLNLGLTATATELNYTDGVTSAIQTQLDGKQPLDNELTALAGLTSAADKGIQFTGAGTAATFDLTAAGKALLDDANAAAQIATLGLDADLATFSLPASTTISTFGASLVDDADAAAARTTLGVVGYTLQAAAATTNPTDGGTNYFGSRFAAAMGSAGNQRIYIPKTGTVKAIYLFFQQTAGSNEASTLSFRLNNTTDTTISAAVTHDAGTTSANNTGLSIAVTAGDYFEIKAVWPTWVTNPTGVVSTAVVYIEP
jgi:hypothetical protein